MLDKIKGLFSFLNDWKFFVPVIAAIVMYFTPDSVDTIIKTTLRTFGFTVYEIKPDDEKQ